MTGTYMRINKKRRGEANVASPRRAVSARPATSSVTVTSSDGSRKASGPNSTSISSADAPPISAGKRLPDRRTCSTRITVNSAVIAKSIPVKSTGSACPSSAPMHPPKIQ